jgi:hypothetical protein
MSIAPTERTVYSIEKRHIYVRESGLAEVTDALIGRLGRSLA